MALERQRELGDPRRHPGASGRRAGPASAPTDLKRTRFPVLKIYEPGSQAAAGAPLIPTAQVVTDEEASARLSSMSMDDLDRVVLLAPDQSIAPPPLPV